MNVGDNVLVPAVIDQIVPSRPGFPEPCIVARLADVFVAFAPDEVRATDDVVTVNRADLQDALTVIWLHTPIEFIPSIIVDRLTAAVGESTAARTKRQGEA